MNCCSHRADRDRTPTTIRTWLARAWSLTQWATPIAALALMPKCPACVAAYVLLLTGAGISFAAASAFQSAVVWLCWAALVLLGTRLTWRGLARWMSPDARRIAAQTP